MKIDDRRLVVLVRDIIEIFSSHEVDSEIAAALSCNDPNDLFIVIKKLLAETDRTKLNEIMRNVDWDEEYDLSYDDYGLSSIVQSLGMSFKRNGVIDEDGHIYVAPVREVVRTDYKVLCPSCLRDNNISLSVTPKGSVITCGICKSKIRLIEGVGNG